MLVDYEVNCILRLGRGEREKRTRRRKKKTA